MSKYITEDDEESVEDEVSIDSVDDNEAVVVRDGDVGEYVEGDDDSALLDEDMDDDSALLDEDGLGDELEGENSGSGEEGDSGEEDDDGDEEDDEEMVKKTVKRAKNAPTKKQRAVEDDEEDYGDDEEYFQKIKQHISNSKIYSEHPELQFVNVDEIEALCNIVRDAKGNIIDPLHTTLPFITKYEKAAVIGKRATQINEISDDKFIFTEIDPTLIDGGLIALKEFDEKNIPFIIQRPLPNGAMEYWRLRDLEII